MEFNPEKEIQNIINFIKTYYQENNLKGAIIGISGGKDSAVAAALFTKALGKENVIGITMPCHSKSKDKSDAEIISNHLGITLYNIDLSNVYDTFKQEITKTIKPDKNQTENSDINLKPRLRMATLYYMAALFTQINNQAYLVIGTGNKCEIYVGYYTKGGDGMSDINVIADYKVSEIIKIGEALGVPTEILYKTPSDGLSNQSDEDKLGVTYQEIEDVIDGKQTPNQSYIKRLNKANEHKKSIKTYQRSW